MTDTADVVGALVWMALIGAWLAHHLWAQAAGRRQEAGLCTRCGRNPVASAVQDAPRRPTLCQECLRATYQAYRLGSWFFYGIGGLFGLMAPFLIAFDFKRFGARAALADTGLLAALIGLTAATGWGIRYFGRKVE